MISTHSQTLGLSVGSARQLPSTTPLQRAGSTLSRTGSAIWHALEDVGQARANRELRLLADRCAITDPALAAQLRQASRFDATSRHAIAAKP